MTVRISGIALLLLAGCAAAAQALAGINASLNASQVASGDTVQLTLEHDGRISGQPDLTPLQRDFDILGTSNSTTYELINGSASERTEVILTLAPKVTGNLTIPALSWDGERSQPLSLTVTGPGGAGAGTGQAGSSGTAPAAKVFMEMTASPEQPYVEAAVHLTVRLFTSETLYHADLELPENVNILVKQVGSDEESNAQRNGTDYQVFTRRYLLFPLHSGKLTVAGPVLDAEVAAPRAQSIFGNNPFGGFFSGFQTARPLRVHGNPIVLAVRARPAGAVGSYWLPARNVTVSAAWNPAQLTAHAGDPVTLDVDLQATGLTAAQLPDLSSLLSFPSGLKAYPDQPKLTDSSQNGSLIGSRDQTIALMADSPGRYTVPALTVTWWDTQNNQPRTATLPARTLTILPAPGSAPSPGAAPAGTVSGNTAVPATSAVPAASSAVSTTPAASTTHQGSISSAPPGPSSPAAPEVTPAHSPSVWEWISIGLGIAWLATLGAWLWSRRPRPAPPPITLTSAGAGPGVGARERAAFRAACQANDARAARAHLLAWTAARWGATPAGINAIATTIGDAQIAELLRDLDRACYAGGAWQGQPLAAALTDLPAPPDKTARKRDRLAPLYPESVTDRSASIRRR